MSKSTSWSFLHEKNNNPGCEKNDWKVVCITENERNLFTYALLRF